MNDPCEDIAIVLRCEGLGDCLFAISVIKKLHSLLGKNSKFAIFTVHAHLFRKCPYVQSAFDFSRIGDVAAYKKHLVLFNSSDLSHLLMDTFDYISIPAGIGTLSFREKQLEYFPVEEDNARTFDVVINTSVTWPSRSWPAQNWQIVADFIIKRGYSVAVVGKDTFSKLDNLWKRSYGLKGCVDLTNQLSLDQTFYTIKKSGLFITCQNGLSVMSGATDAEIIILDMSIEWSKRAIYRKENPHYKVTYVKGNCDLYCCEAFHCPRNENFRCIPSIETVLDVIESKLILLQHLRRKAK